MIFGRNGLLPAHIAFTHFSVLVRRLFQVLSDIYNKEAIIFFLILFNGVYPVLRLNIAAHLP